MYAVSFITTNTASTQLPGLVGFSVDLGVLACIFVVSGHGCSGMA
jgi:hypothetical protein